MKALAFPGARRHARRAYRSPRGDRHGSRPVLHTVGIRPAAWQRVPNLHPIRSRTA